MPGNTPQVTAVVVDLELVMLGSPYRQYVKRGGGGGGGIYIYEMVK